MPELSFTGERIVPLAENCEPNFADRMYQEHIARYNFCEPACVGKAVLDVGCGVGYGSQRLALMGAASVYAFDISIDAIRHARRNFSHPLVNFFVDDAEVFEVPQPVDLVVCFELIEHVNHPEKVLRKIRQALKPDGVLIMSTPRALEEKRTHHHTKEFSFEEFSNLIGSHFNNYKMYAENNHFVSIVGDEAESQIHKTEFIAGLPLVSTSDVFIAVASSEKLLKLPSFPKVAAISTDAYVTMLENDVKILHKAEDDLKEKFEYTTKDAEQTINFYKAEVREVREYLERAEKELNAVRSEAGAQGGSASDISRLEGELASIRQQLKSDLEGGVIFQQEQLAQMRSLEELTASLKELVESTRLQLEVARQDVGSEREEARRELFRIVSGADENVWALSSEIRKATAELHALQLDLKTAMDVHASLDGENRMLAARLSDVELKLESERSEAGRELGRVRADADQKIRMLSNEALLARGKVDSLQTELTSARVRLADLESTERTFSVRLLDAEGRRADAYEYARSVSMETNSWRGRYESLKRDLHQALTGEFRGASVISPSERGHSDVLRAISEQFPGMAATSYVVRDEALVGVDHLRGEVESLREQILGRERDFAHIEAMWREHQDNAERILSQSFNEPVLCVAEVDYSDWQRTLEELRSSTSWRVTRPLRSISIFVKSPSRVARRIREFAQQNGLASTFGLLFRKLTGLGRDT